MLAHIAARWAVRALALPRIARRALEPARAARSQHCRQHPFQLCLLDRRGHEPLHISRRHSARAHRSHAREQGGSACQSWATQRSPTIRSLPSGCLTSTLPPLAPSPAALRPPCSSRRAPPATLPLRRSPFPLAKPCALAHAYPRARRPQRAGAGGPQVVQAASSEVAAQRARWTLPHVRWRPVPDSEAASSEVVPDFHAVPPSQASRCLLAALSLPRSPIPARIVATPLARTQRSSSSPQPAAHRSRSRAAGSGVPSSEVAAAGWGRHASRGARCLERGGGPAHAVEVASREVAPRSGF